MKISIVKEKGHTFDETICTQTIGFIGRKRTGKSYAAGVLFEKIHSIGGQQIVFDPVGNWKAITLDRSGKKPGLSITVFGGPKGHLPLPVDSGRVIGRMLMEKRISAVLDVSRFNDEDRERFVSECVQAIYEVAQERDGSDVCTLYFEEAQFFIPEGVGIKSKMFKRIMEAVRVGGNYGLGVVMITQRPQSVNKEILNQVELLFVGQLNGKHERDAIEGWIVAQGVDLKDEMKQLPGFKRGEFFMWSPSWLETFARVHIRRKETFDGSATPTLGSKVKTMKIAPVDVEVLQAAIQDTIKTYNENDPGALKREVAKLRSELAKQKPADLDINELERIIDPVMLSKLGELQAAVQEAIRSYGKRKGLHITRDLAHESSRKVKASPQPLFPRNEGQPSRAVTPKAIKVEVVKPHRVRGGTLEGDIGLDKCQRAVLSVLALHGRAMALKEVCILTGYRITSGGLAQAIADLIKLNYVKRENKMLQITSMGSEAIPTPDQLPTGVDLLEFWKKHLKGAHANILQVLYDYGGAMVSFDQVCNATGYKPTSGGLAQALADLKKLQLITVPERKHFAISASFF